MDAIKKLKEIIDKSNDIVFFGGAGVSTESGIPDFRSVDGLYNQRYKYPPEKIISHSFYLQNTEEFFEFYKEKMLVLDAKPNTAHTVLARLEKEGKVKAVITQNIDGLHQMAGSKEVLELHGSIHRNFCTNADCRHGRKVKDKPYDALYIRNQKGVPRCKACGNIVKPDVVLYEEGLDQETMQKSVKYISEAEVLIIGGTSLAVYPAASLIDYFKGDYLVVINMAPTPRDTYADLLISEKIGEVFAKL